MKLRLAVLLVVVLAFPLAAGAAPTFKVVFSAPTHTPKVNAKWWWSLKVTTAAGKPVPARITVQLVDPFGGVHPVEFGCCKRNIKNHPIKGSFRDYVTFPPTAQGFRLKFQVIVKAAGGTRTVTYWVKPR